MSSVIASKYAQAIFDEAMQQDQLEQYSEQLALLRQMYESNQDFYRFVHNPDVPSDQKKFCLSEILKTFQCAEKFICFACLLVENKRFDMLSQVVDSYARLKDQQEGVTRAKIVLTPTVGEDVAQQVTALFEETLSRKIIWTREVDSSLMAGFQVCLDDWVFDGSLKRQMDQLLESLIYEDSQSSV